jgi:para-aminobenzoate synthetase component 1
MTTNSVRSFISFSVDNFIIKKQQMLNWGNQFDICCFFDNNQYASAHHSYECVLAAGAKRIIKTSAGNAFNELKQFYDAEPDWLFGHLGYDLKNEVEQLKSAHPDGIKFPDLFFFVPEYIILLSGPEISISSLTERTPEDIWKDIDQIVFREENSSSPVATDFLSAPITIKSRFTKEEYINTVSLLRDHILKGDCYEINFCQEFFAENILVDPLATYISLCNISPNPFAAFYKVADKYLLCASPERYIKKTGDHLISQPIKGTSQRDIENETIDKKNKQQLLASEKERAENVMVVDLVRNDLSKVCEEGSVKVDELYSIYSFPQVHQMISTISGTARKELHWTDILRATFPMGSMTGAPKKKVMELIETYERTKRSVFSGAVGYITPEADFDFNVVIRSILMNTTERYLSYQVGSAITFNSEPEKEYEECLLKAAAIKKVISSPAS